MKSFTNRAGIAGSKLRGLVLLSMVSVCLLTALRTSSQENAIVSPAALAEKIYLQLDNTVYTTDQTIWFKAVVANAADHEPGKASGVLYVELVDANEQIVERKITRLQQGMGEGFFQLAPYYPHGVYQLRAYTNWNRNFGAFFFTTYILIAGPDGKQPVNPIRQLILVETAANERRLRVDLDPAAGDSLPGKAARFVLTVDDTSDTLLVKKSRDHQYLLDRVIPANSQSLTLQVQGDDHRNYAKTIILDPNWLDLQFFPESGELVQGLPAVLGIKAVDYSGKGRQVAGEIRNANGGLVAGFTTNTLGTGTVRLEQADSALHYTASIQSAGGPALPVMYALPAVVAKGNTLSVRKSSDRIIFTARSNYLSGDSVVVRASCRGLVYYDFKGVLKNGSFEFGVTASDLPEGVINFTMLTSRRIPVAERLYFNERPGQRINITITPGKNEYGQREQMQLTIETKDAQGQPVPANFSLGVVNTPKGQADHRQTILSYFLLSSDLKGTIENPGYYFSQSTDTTQRLADLDALLLTQGWRKYNYTRDTVTIRFQQEAMLTVSGTVKGGLTDKKPVKDAGLIMMTLPDHHIYQQQTDSLGRFLFPLEEHGDNLEVLIQSTNKSSKQKNYLITLDKKESPPVAFEHIREAGQPDSIIKAYIKKSIDYKKTADAYAIANGASTLQDVVVKGYAITPERKAVTERFGKPKEVIEGQVIRDKEAKWSYGLYSVLLFNFPEKVKIERRPDGNLYAGLYNFQPTLVVVDGIPVMAYEYGFVPSIPPSEVKSFEIIENAKDFMGLYCEVFRDNCLTAPAWGNVIAIYTYAGKGLNGVKPTVGITQTAVPVYATPREFYSPKYDQLKPEDWLKPDLRSLVYWQPNLHTDSTGRATVSFYNPDNTGTMQVVVEAIADSGGMGYGEGWYWVKESMVHGR